MVPLLIKYTTMELGITKQVVMILWDIGDLMKEAGLQLKTLPATVITEPLVLFLEIQQLIQFGRKFK